MVEPVQPLATGRAQGRLTEGFELGEGRGAGPALDSSGQGQWIASGRVLGEDQSRRGHQHGETEQQGFEQQG